MKQKNLISHTLIILALSLIASTANASTYIDGMYFELNEKAQTASLTYANYSFGGYAGDVIIPEKIEYSGKTYVVTSVLDRAFYACKDMASLTVPSTVTKFDGTSIFYGCTGLKRIVLEDGSSAITIPGCVYTTGSGNTKATFHFSTLESVYVGRDIITSSSSVSDSPFYDQSNLTEVTIGSQVTLLPKGFVHGSGITEINIPEGVKTIGDNAISRCPQLKEIIFPQSVETFGESVCLGSAIERAFVGDKVSALDGIFYYCKNLKEAYIGSGLRQLGIADFRYCSNLTVLYLFSDNINSIDDGAFPDNLSRIYVPVPSHYASQITDITLDQLMTFNSVTQEYTGALPQLSYQNNVENTNVSLNLSSEYINVGAYSLNAPVLFSHKTWKSLALIPLQYTIAPAPLLVIPENISRSYRTPNPNLTGLIIGFKNNETEEILDKLPIYTTTASIESLPGTYPIIPSGAEARNYTFSYERGTLTITKAKNLLAWDQQIAEMEIGESLPLVFSVENAISEPIFSQYDPSIISVYKSGESWLVKALASGATNLAIQYPGNDCYENSNLISKTIKVNKEPEIQAQSISLNKTTLTLPVGTFETLIAVVAPENTTDKTIIWTSNNVNIATVTSNGSVLAIGVGSTYVTATCGEAKATCAITVLPVDATNVFLNKTSVDMTIGDSELLIATVVPENATDKSVTWFSSNEEIVSVSSTGLLTALGVGNAVVTAQCGKLQATCNVKVNPILASAITLNKDELSLQIGESEQLVAQVLPDNATDKRVVWASSDESVATVDEYGVVMALTSGTAVISASTIDGSELTAQCALNASSGINDIYVDNRNISIETKGNVVFVKGVIPESMVLVYDTIGCLVYAGKEHTFSLGHKGVYIIAVENVRKKIVIR